MSTLRALFSKKAVLFPTVSVVILLIATGSYYWATRPRPAPGITSTPISTVNGGEQGTETLSRPASAIPTFSLILSEGKMQPQKAEPLTLASGEPLTPEEVTQILARLPEMTPEPGDQTEFNLPATPQAPPKPGTTIQDSFPPAEPPAQAQPPAESGPLQVLRY